MVKGKVWCLAVVLSLTFMCVWSGVILAKEKPDSKMVYVEGGTFSEDGAKGDTEKASSLVTVNSFYISKYETTVAEYDAFCIATKRKSWLEPGLENRAVRVVTWYDAVEYCNWLSNKEGLKPCYVIKDKQVTCNFSAKGYRLPTEAEWEYAAMGGKLSKGFKYSGSDDVDEVAWTFFSHGPNFGMVGQKKPNELGIYDMSGNAAEWCWDENTGGSYRTIRGGSFNSRWLQLLYVHKAMLDSMRPDDCSEFVGFRVVRTK